MKPIETVIAELAARTEAKNNKNDAWWMGYASGLRRAATMIEVHRILSGELNDNRENGRRHAVDQQDGAAQGIRRM